MPDPKSSDLLPPPIAFRLQPDQERILVRRASELVVTPNKLARRYVLDALECSLKPEALNKQLYELTLAISTLRVDLRASVRAILVATRNVDKEQIDLWMRENLK